MEVILLERIARLGRMGDIVRVKNGYARNYLLPQKKALRTTKANLARFESERKQLEAASQDQQTRAQAQAAKLEKPMLVLLRQAADTGQLYGSVSSRDVMASLAAQDIAVTRQQIILNTAIKRLGLHPVRVMLHPEVPLELTLNVARTEAEAKRQEAGEDVIASEASKRRKPRAEADAKPADAETPEAEAAEAATADGTDKKTKKSKAAKAKDTSAADTSAADTSAADTSAADTSATAKAKDTSAETKT